jgi:hypothetical protein
VAAHAHPEVQALLDRITTSTLELLAHGHGRLEVEFDSNPAGRRRVVVRAAPSWMHVLSGEP